MNREEINTLFRATKSLEKLDYDPKVVQEDFTPDRLAAIIVTSYEIGQGAYDEGYQDLIDAAIRANNQPALALLWKGVYYHDRSNPDFGGDLKLAAEVSNLELFKYVLHAYQTWSTLFENEPVSISKLVALAKTNPDPEVLKFVLQLSISVSNLVIVSDLNECTDILKTVTVSEVAPIAV